MFTSATTILYDVPKSVSVLPNGTTAMLSSAGATASAGASQ